jgi:hypothetical protein
VVVGLGGVAAEKDIAVVVDGLDGDSGRSEDVAAVAAARAPEGIEDDLDAGNGNGFEIDQFGDSGEIGGLDVGGFEVGLGSRSGAGCVGFRRELRWRLRSVW